MAQPTTNPAIFRNYSAHIMRKNSSSCATSFCTKISMNIKTIGRFLTLFFIAFLPWSVVISVLGTEKMHLGIFRFIKEIIIAIIAGCYIFESMKKKIKIALDSFDIVTIIFALVLIVVSILQHTSLKGIFY